MKRIFQYTAIVIALSFAASCNIIEEGNSIEGGLISFEPQAVETKAMVTPDNVTGEIFDVWDFMGTTVHIQDSIQYNGSKWAYKSSTTASYPWKSGEHKFFGYTRRNAGSFDQSTMIWSISERTITAGKNQTDLLYSSIKDTTATGWKNVHQKDDPVLLQFHHLLSAIRITLVNGSGEDVTVSSAAVTLPNTGSATVSFGGDDAVPSVTVGTTPGAFGGFTAQKSLAAGDSLNVLDGTVLTTANTLAAPYMIWPQTPQTLAENAATIAVILKVGSAAEKTVPIPIPATTWAAGKINSYRLLIYPNDIKLVFEVQDWQKESFTFTTMANASINMTNVSWMNTKVKLTQNGSEVNTVDIGGKSVTMYYKPYINTSTDPNHPSWTQDDGYYPAQGFFTVNYPESGVFKIGLKPAVKSESTPDPEAVFDATKYEIYIYDPNVTGHWREHNQTNGETITRNTVYFQVRAASGQDGNLHKAQVDIWFKPTGSTEWISAYSEVRATYALTIPATN